MPNVAAVSIEELLINPGILKGEVFVLKCHTLAYPNVSAQGHLRRYEPELRF